MDSKPNLSFLQIVGVIMLLVLLFVAVSLLAGNLTLMQVFLGLIVYAVGAVWFGIAVLLIVVGDK